MTEIMHLSKITALCGAFLFLTATPSAEATAKPADQYEGWLRLSVSDGGEGQVKSVTLACGPDNGDHPEPATACRQLRGVAGRISKLNVDPGPCTDEYHPRVARALGFWGNRPVVFQHTYSNPCVLYRTTGAVFKF
jgi:hypothetical protein